MNTEKNYEQAGFAASAEYVRNPPPAFNGIPYVQVGKIYAHFHTQELKDERVRLQAMRDFQAGWTHELY